MDWNLAIERNRQALKRVLAMLVSMAALGRPVQSAFFQQGGAAFWKPFPQPALPRHLHRAVLRLLRPAEAAARRLIIVAARGLVAAAPPARPQRSKPQSAAPLLRSLGIAVIMPAADFSQPAGGRPAAAAGPAPRMPVLPLFDLLRPPRPGRPRFVPAHAAPRISFPGATVPHRLPPPPSPDDPLDATRLCLRLRALEQALDDLPKHARRFARWRARRDRASADGRRPRRLSPLKPGRPPGSRRRPAHEVHEMLAELNHLARWALARPDTS